jgi:hypothetical protein
MRVLQIRKIVIAVLCHLWYVVSWTYIQVLDTFLAPSNRKTSRIKKRRRFQGKCNQFRLRTHAQPFPSSLRMKTVVNNYALQHASEIVFRCRESRVGRPKFVMTMLPSASGQRSDSSHALTLKPFKAPEKTSVWPKQVLSWPITESACEWFLCQRSSNSLDMPAPTTTQNPNGTFATHLVKATAFLPGAFALRLSRHYYRSCRDVNRCGEYCIAKLGSIKMIIWKWHSPVASSMTK